MKKKSSLYLLICMMSLLFSPQAFATNGMNLEGYGPIATGMGGASMAYDNGVAAVMNNPATLGLMPEGNRFDAALGYLGPHVKTEMSGIPSAKSSADVFLMPALGWAKKSDSLVYGFGVFSQGGMGTEYDANSFLAMGSGDKVLSELGVGRFIVPLAYNVTPDLTVAGTIDYVWASLDLKMAMPGSTMASLVTSCSDGGSGAICGPGGALSGLASASWTRLDFAGGGDFNGSATGNGLAGKLGAVYRITPNVTVGAAYHSKTKLNDMSTDVEGAALSASGMGTVGTGQIKVRDFQWPETYAIGAAWNVSPLLMISADIKQINWKDVMKDFRMTYSGPVGGSNATIDFALPQDWKNQTVYEVGAAYKLTEPLVLRAGANISSNPIPNELMNPLFPAIVKNHYTIGAGYAFSKAMSTDASFTYAPEVKATNSSGVTVAHSQTNAQIMFSYGF